MLETSSEVGIGVVLTAEICAGIVSRLMPAGIRLLKSDMEQKRSWG